MKTQLLYVLLVMTFIFLLGPTASVAGSKLRLRKKGLQNRKLGPKPAFKILSPRSMKAWARSQRRRRGLKIPTSPILKSLHQPYRNAGVLLSIGRPLHHLTKSELACYSVNYNNDLLKDLQGNPKQAAVGVTLRNNRYLAKAEFKKFSRTSRLYMVTLGTSFSKNILRIKVHGATDVELPASSWHWNETAKQYQALCTIAAPPSGVVTISVVCDVNSNAYYYGWFHHIQMMLVE